MSVNDIYINRHYAANQPSAMNSQIRKLIFTLFLDLRADWSGKVGLEGQGYSSYVYIADRWVGRVYRKEFCWCTILGNLEVMPFLEVKLFCLEVWKLFSHECTKLVFCLIFVPMFR